MIKFLRKYNKWLLGIGGSLLMVTFLLTGPQSIFQPNQNKQVVATVGDEKIKWAETHAAEQEYEALHSLWRYGIEALGIKNGAHWMLLKREAAAAGLVGGSGDGQKMREEIAAMQAQQMSMFNQGADIAKMRAEIDEQMKSTAVPHAAAMAHQSIPEFEHTLSYLRGVLRLRQQYTNAARVSDVRGIAHLKDNYDGVVVDGLVIPAERLIASQPEPTEQQVAEQYQKYRDVKAGTGEFGFGYLQPSRIKYEYLTLDRAAFRAAADLDPVAVSKYYQQHRDKYPGEETVETARVQTDLVNVKADQMMNEAERLYTTRLKPDVRALANENGFRKLPADWNTSGLRLSALATAITDGLRTAGTNVTPSVIVRDQGWTRVSDLSHENGIGNSTFRVGTNEGNFEKLIGQMHEFNAKTPLTLQSRLPYETYLTDSGTQNRYFLNVLDWRPEGAPENIDEVRTEVVHDLKLKAAYDQLVHIKDDIRSKAISEGLDALAKQYPAPAALGAIDPTPTPLPIFRYAVVNKGNATGDLNVKELREAIVAKSRDLGPQLVATPENLPDRTMVTPLPGKLSLGVVQVLGGRPITGEVLRQVGRNDYNSFAAEELREVNKEESDPFSFDQISKRYAYKAIKDESLPGEKRKQ